MKKITLKLIMVVFYLFFLSAPSLALAAAEDYAGTYSGSYSGTDSGIWTAKFDAQGEGFGFAYSIPDNFPDYGNASINSIGEFVAWMEGGATLYGSIDSSGDVQGTWSNFVTGDSGSLSGKINADEDIEIFEGRYSGTFSGTDSGTWAATINSEGNISASSTSDYYNQSDTGSGFVNSSGEFAASMDGGSILYGVIDSSGFIEGVWRNQYTADNGALSGSKEVSDDNNSDSDGSGGGCFISRIKADFSWQW